MKSLKFAVGMALAAGLLIWPETALNAARQAMWTWTQSVAPALFPFMALMPLLTCREAVQAYERLLGKILPPLLHMPGAAAPALVIGMTAGSPAGALAAVRVSAAAGLNRSQMERLVFCVCGLSPAFLVTGIGASMLGNAADGWLLLRAQILTQLTLLLLTRHGANQENDLPAVPESMPESTLSAAVNGVLAVCGYMVLYNVAAALLAEALRNPWAGIAVLCALDLPSGARTLANLPMNAEIRLILLSALVGFGGLCIAAQNLAACRTAGVRPLRYFAMRIGSAGMMAGWMGVQLQLRVSGGGRTLSALPFAALIACGLAVPVLFQWMDQQSLNKESFSENQPIELENEEKPQDMAVFNQTDIKIM